MFLFFCVKINTNFVQKNECKMNFKPEQAERYKRHMMLEELGAEGQEKISSAKVLVVGAGGLGSPVLLYLASAGVGTLGIIDGDEVDLSNIQRQVIHFTSDVGKAKVLSAKEKINQINPDVCVIGYRQFLTAENACSIIKDYDFIVSATDNFSAKFLVNDTCVLLGKPFSHGGILRFEGQTMTHLPGTACYRCLFQSQPGEMPALTGILGAVAGMLGTIQAAEVLKYLTKTGELLTNKLLTFDAKTMDFSIIRVKKNPACPLCDKSPGITASQHRLACASCRAERD